MLDQPRGGAAYAVFGKVVEGMEVVDKIRDVDTQKHPAFGNREKASPVEPVVIRSVRVVGEEDEKEESKPDASEDTENTPEDDE